MLVTSNLKKTVTSKKKIDLEMHSQYNEMSVNKHHAYKGFQMTLHSSIEAKLYQFELKAILVVFLPK